ncbi:superfamily I DNA and/or RNA helicase [Thermodesulfovibrio aggregans]|uniref:Superfamily I DNA and/or RNA helicase n=1 Tax=Thermodesulfovibrio aggregans TaxID=86166 RepID=A0A0U9HRB0_9BACT|nr:AAA domain-containing protein [Thermodesulfovibrio aggregans]GAQ95560.1 superfamily I DNA and/or RNA helicase [Thermodesulfovibrio aggregans]
MKKSKIERLLRYLQTLATLRTKIIRRVDEYPHFIWLNEIAENEKCYCKIKEKKDESDIVAEVKLTRKPEIPSALREYLKNRGISCDDKDEFEELEEKHKIRYRDFLNEWKQWKSLYKIYCKLYSIYQESLRLGEEYEFLLCLGLLSWRSEKKKEPIKRHIVTKRLNLEFDAKSQKFIIREDVDYPVKIETEFIPIEDLPERFDKLKDEGLKVIEEKGIWSEELKEYLKKFVHTIHPNGKFSDSLSADLRDYSSNPKIEYAPALIYRKRSIGPFYDFLTSLLDKCKNVNEVNFVLRDFAEIEKITKSEQKLESPIDYSNLEIYFPKPYNDEQLSIIERVQKFNVVLVQGPPGTGKSHTIANLICHLLANGKRILITSKSSRALQVLKNLIPEEIRSLCVIMLGEAKDERKQLEESVSGILNKINSWTDKFEEDIKSFEKELRELKQKEVDVKNKLKEFILRENQQVRLNSRYIGTPVRISKLVIEDTPKFSWFKDEVKYEQHYELQDFNWEEFLDSVRYFSNPEKNRLLNSKIPTANEMLTPEEMQKYFKEEKDIKKILEELEPKVDKDLLKSLSKKPELTHTIKNLFSDYRKVLLNLSPSFHNWTWLQKLTNDCFCGDLSIWKERVEKSTELLKRIAKNIEILRDNSLEILNLNKPLETILEDLSTLRDYLSKGGSKGWFIFKPKIIREREYIFTNIYVNGKQCRTIDELNTALLFLEAEISIKRILDEWSSYLIEVEDLQMNKPIGRYYKLSEIIQTLTEILELKRLRDTCSKAMAELELTLIDFLNDKQIRQIIETCDYFIYSQRLNEVQSEIERLSEKYEKFDKIPQIQKLLVALKDRNSNSYEEALLEIQEINLERSKRNELRTDIRKLKSKVPRLVEDMLKDPHNPEWNERIKLIPIAWEWAQAKDWIEKYTNLNIYSLNKELEKIESKKRAIITKIVELKSWHFLKNSMNEENIRHLIGWQQSMKRLGKGTGKYAYKHRKDAQIHLNYIKNRIPCWIIPLYRVWDTVKPEKEIFDFIIVDEASQIGFEGIPLFYLAKKILIVGDDKQISPEPVGVDKNDVYKLMNDLLYDFKFRDSFDLENSLFAHAELRYSSSKVCLREHFRCMPEIINFSNQLCYSDSPLIPLRQYPPYRLNPLEKVYITDANCEGEGASIRNELEAEFIAEKVAELCKDKRYENKTMGIIILQGQAQANLIDRMIFEKISTEEIQRRRIICGNPYSFQGDERDIIFLSMVIAPNKRIGVLSDEHDRRRFNVAVSRARDQIWLFHSVKIEDLSPGCFRRSLLEYFYFQKPQKIGQLDLEQINMAHRADRRLESPPIPFESWFEFDVALELFREGYIIIPQYKVANYRIDLVVEGGHRRIAIECDGDQYHDGEQIDKDFYRQRILERCGWKFFRIRASDFYYRKSKIMDDLKKTLELYKIRPVRASDKKSNSERAEDTLCLS